MTPIRIGEPWEGDPTKLSLRAFSGARQDYQALAYVRNETLRATAPPEDYRALNTDEMARFYDRGGFALANNAWLMAHGDEPAAAAVIYPMAAFDDLPPGNFHLYVLPRLWGRGLGSRLLDHLQQAALQRGHPVLETTIASEDEQSTRFLGGHGFSVVGHSMRLARSNLDNLPSAGLPGGYTIRSLSGLGESPELYRETANRLGAYDPNYSLITPEELDRQTAGDGWDPTGVLFLLDAGGRIVGIIRASRPEPSRGYLNEVRLEPTSRGKGLGMSIVAAALRYLAAGGDVGRVELDTAGENTPAHNLALKAGFEETRHWLRFLKRL